MSKHDKTLAKLCRTPPPAGIKWDELKALLESLGYEMLKNTGSRRKFFHREKGALIICHEPHPSPDIGKGTAADIANHLKENGFIKDSK